MQTYKIYWGENDTPNYKKLFKLKFIESKDKTRIKNYKNKSAKG